MNTRDSSKWVLLQRKAIKKERFQPWRVLSFFHHLAELLYTHHFMFSVRCRVWCSSLGRSGLFCFLCGTSGIDWPVTLSFPCLCTVQGFFPPAWTSSELRVRASLLCLLAPCAGAGPGCFEEWPFHQGWPTKLPGMGSGSRFLAQSGLLLLVNCCSTLTLNTVVCMICPTSEITWICETRFPSLSHQEGCKGGGRFCALPWMNWESACQSRRYILESPEVFFPSVLLRASCGKWLSRDAGRKAVAGTTFVCVFADR